jgi:hypothetical protein
MSPGLLQEHLWPVTDGATLDSAVAAIPATAMDFTSRAVNYASVASFGPVTSTKFAYRAAGDFHTTGTEKISFFMSSAGEAAELKVNGETVIAFAGHSIPVVYTSNDPEYWQPLQDAPTMKQYTVDLQAGTHNIEVAALSPAYLDLSMTTGGLIAANKWLYGANACPAGYGSFGPARCVRDYGTASNYNSEVAGGLVHAQTWEATTTWAHRFAQQSTADHRMEHFDSIFAAVPAGAETSIARHVDFTLPSPGGSGGFETNVVYKATSSFTASNANTPVTFLLTGANQGKVFVDGVCIVNTVGRSAAADKVGYDVVGAGEHTIEVESFSPGTDGSLRLRMHVADSTDELYGDAACPADYTTVGGQCNPIVTAAPTQDPTKSPTKAPTENPTKAPTESPTAAAGDCVFSNWGEWSTCTAICEGGTTTRIREVLSQATDGGRECTVDSTTQSQSCNTHTCTEFMTCHEKHVRCHVQYNHFEHGRVDTCNKAQPECHSCDTAAECSMKAITRNIAVTHDQLGTSVVESAQFKCAVENNACVCKCDTHPTGAYTKGRVFSHSPGFLVGGAYDGVTRNKCSNLCTHHPDCRGWQWETTLENGLVHSNYHLDTGKCLLVDTVSPLVPNTDTSKVTYVALKSSKDVEKRQKVVDHLGNNICSYTKYAVKDSNGEYTKCEDCPVGRFSLQNYDGPSSSEPAFNWATDKTGIDCMGNTPPHLQSSSAAL